MTNIIKIINLSIYIGYVYKEQIFKALPFEKHDLKLNAIVTDTFV